MSEFVKTIEAIKTDGLTPPPYLVGDDLKKYESSKIRINEILKILKNTAAILDSNEVPLYLVNLFITLLGDFKSSHVDGFTRTIEANPNAMSYYQTAMLNLENFHNRFFEISSSNSTLLLIDAIDNYKFQDSLQIESRSNKIVEEAAQSRERFDSLIEQLKQDASKRVMTDYGNIFLKQESKHRTASNIWLLIAIISSVAFLTFFILSLIHQWFPYKATFTDVRDGHISTNEVFNIPELIGKVVVISFILFMISFFFRQFSINKNLQVINQQRKNAFNSYDLFAATAGSDNAAKQVLLLELAKSIYQMTHTGFVSSKQTEATNNQLLELTRVFQEGGKS
jgi:uncharacterized membrane protein